MGHAVNLTRPLNATGQKVPAVGLGGEGILRTDGKTGQAREVIKQVFVLLLAWGPHVLGTPPLNRQQSLMLVGNRVRSGKDTYPIPHVHLFLPLLLGMTFLACCGAGRLGLLLQCLVAPHTVFMNS